MQTFYLKYRPQSLTDLRGQGAVVDSLLSAFKGGKLSHAYLLHGPRGTGKTSTARILAKMINCSSKSPPCNKCSTCLSITDGSNLDLIEIDAASNRGIDDIRVLRETIKLAPSSAKKKVYIIDEVHMLTQEAFNALLKTLEEPPSHALFILATTEVAKVPQTILSRVQRLDFKLASSSELVKLLLEVAKKEGISIEDEAVKLLARAAEGSFRDAVKLLDQLSSKEKITPQDVEEILRSSNFASVVKCLQCLAKKELKSSLMELHSQVEKGAQTKEIIFKMQEILRELLLIKADLGPALVRENWGLEKYQTLTELAENFQLPELIKCVDVLQGAFEKLKTASIPSLPLELAIVEMCEDLKIEDGSSKIEKAKDPPSTIHNPSSNNDSPDIARLQEKWTFVLETIRPYNFSLEALLRSVKIADVNGEKVLLEVPYSFHQRILEAPKSRDLLESVLSDVLQKSVKVSCVLGQRPQSIEDIANVEVAADDEVISLASEIFNGKLVD